MRHSFKAAMLSASLAIFAASPELLAQDEDELSHDGLMQMEDSRADEVYVLPEADFSLYDKFIIEEPVVAFRRNWERDFNRRTSGSRIRAEDMERIKNGMKELFLEVFTQELEDAGYAVVEEPAEDVMTLRPSITDLDVAAPDVPAAGRNRSYVTSAGSARLHIEFFDSLTDQILARASDYQRARNINPDSFQWATSASNRAEARRVLQNWSDMLIERLDEIHGE